MFTFAQDLFGGGRFLRWSLFSVAVVTSALMASVPYDWSPVNVALLLTVEMALLLLALAMVAPRRCAWAGRVLAGMTFAAFVVYLGAELWEDPSTLFGSPRRSESTALTALLGLVIIGLPALGYALSGPREPDPSEELLEVGGEFDEGGEFPEADDPDLAARYTAGRDSQ